MNTVLITGITGFIGRQMASDYFRKGWRVVGIGVQESSPEGVHAYSTMRLPSEDLANKIRGWRPDICIHCAGSASVASSVSDPMQDFNSNVIATFNLLDAIRKNAPECRVIYLSSAAIYGQPVDLPVSEQHSVNPISPYGYHKFFSEQICSEFHQIYGVRIAVARIFSAYGAGLRRQVVWDICQKFCQQPSDQTISLYGTGKETRDFIHVTDVINALIVLRNDQSFPAIYTMLLVARVHQLVRWLIALYDLLCLTIH